MESAEDLQSHVGSTTKLEAVLLFALYLHRYYVKLTSKIYVTVHILIIMIIYIWYIIPDHITLHVYVRLLHFDVLKCEGLTGFWPIAGFMVSQEVVPLLADTLRLLAVLSIIDWPTRSILLRATCTMGIYEEQSMWRHSSNGQVMWISIPIDINPFKVFLFCAFWYLLFWLHLYMAEDAWAAFHLLAYHWIEVPIVSTYCLLCWLGFLAL